MRSMLFALLLLASPAVAQESGVRVVVTDSLGNRVAFAWVQVRSGVARAADDSGRVAVDAPSADSLRLTVRRIGYTPFDGQVARDSAFAAYRVILNPLPQSLDRINIIAPRENRLFRNGFYSRQEEAWKIGTPSRFLSPEALENRASARTSQLLDGISFVSVRREGGKSILQGRGRCAVTVLLDGRRQIRMVEEVGSFEGEQEITRLALQMPPTVPQDQRMARARLAFIADRQSIDELVSPGTIAAIEVYASANQAPMEFRNQAMTPSCAIVAIWTGPRQ